MKWPKYFIPALVVVLVLNLTACEDYMRENRVTVVQGNVYDTNKQQPVVNTTVYIQTYEIGNSPAYAGQLVYRNILDSVKTDANGNYAITLQGEKYNRSLKLRVILNNARFKINSFGQRWQVYYGEENKIDFNVIELHPLKLRVIVKDNPRPPLTIQIPQAHEKKVIIYGVNADSTVSLSVIPNQTNEVAFHVVHPIRNNNVMSHFDTINAKGFKPVYQSTHTVYPDKFKWESK